MNITKENAAQAAFEFYKLAVSDKYVDTDRKSLRDIFDRYPFIAELFLHEAARGGVDTFTVCQAVNALVNPAYLPTHFTRQLSTTGKTEYCHNTVGDVIKAEIFFDDEGLRVYAQYKAMDLNGHVSSDIPIVLLDAVAFQRLLETEQSEYAQVSKTMYQKKLPRSS